VAWAAKAAENPQKFPLVGGLFKKRAAGASTMKSPRCSLCQSETVVLWVVYQCQLPNPGECLALPANMKLARRNLIRADDGDDPPRPAYSCPQASPPATSRRGRLYNPTDPVWVHVHGRWLCADCRQGTLHFDWSSVRSPGPGRLEVNGVTGPGPAAPELLPGGPKKGK